MGPDLLIAACGPLISLLATLSEPNSDHPRMFLTQDLITQVRSVCSEPGSHHARALETMFGRLRAGPAVYTGRSGYQRATLAREAAFAYQITGDLAYAEQAYQTLMDSRRLDQDQPDIGYGLSRAMMGVGYAFAYDWCYPAWSEQQRRDILHILRAAADAWPHYRHANIDTPHKGSNWVGVTRGGELLLHLSAQGEPGYGDRTDRIQLCLNDLSQHIDTAYGPSGWTQEGLGYLEYTFGFLAPAIYAARDAGYPELWHKFRRISWSHLAMVGLSFRRNHDLLPSGVDGSRSTDEGLASLIWPTVPADSVAAYRWFYDRHLGVLALQPTFDSRRAGTIWAILFYPTSVEAQKPAPRALLDSRKGAFYFRNRWQDQDDILISLMTRAETHSHSWQQSETFGLNIMGFDTTFAGGPGKQRDPVLYSKLLLNERLESIQPEGSLVLSAQADQYGGGIVEVDASRNFKISHARRRLEVDYSLGTGWPAVIRVDDQLANPEPFTATFQLNPEQGVSLELVPARNDQPQGFVLRGKNGWLRGWVHSPTDAEILGSLPLRVRTPSLTSTRFSLVMVLGQGDLPENTP